MASLSSLNLDVNFYGEDKEQVVSTKVKPIKSLSTLSVVVHSDSPGSFWNYGVRKFLIECRSLKTLSLTFHGELIEPYHGFDGLDAGACLMTVWQ